MKSMKTLAKGITAGIAIGAVCYVISQSTPHQKREIKRNANKMLHSFGSTVSTFTSMIR
jgi:hypothetical protein